MQPATGLASSIVLNHRDPVPSQSPDTNTASLDLIAHLNSAMETCIVEPRPHPVADDTVRSYTGNDGKWGLG